MMMQQPVFFLPLWLLLSAFVVEVSSASASNYKPLHYDRMIHFSPDGRLLQVEYAAMAAEHSSPLIVCQLDADTMIAMTCSKQRQRPQDRLVVLEDTVVVAMSGILADSLALLKHALQEWEGIKELYGDQDRATMMLTKIANAIGQACHENCFLGGIRPYGSTMLLMGINVDAVADAESSTVNPFRILQTDPSGGVKPIPIPTLKSQQSTSLELLRIAGGNPDVRMKIEKSIQRLKDSKHHASSTSLWDRIRSVATILLDFQEEKNNPSFFGLKRKRRRKDSGSGGKKRKESTTTTTELLDMHKLEVVVLSRNLGIYRLTEDQTERLVREIMDGM